MDQPNALQKATRLEQAQNRLDSAFLALEHAVSKSLSLGAAENSTQLTSELEQENAALKKRNESLKELNARIVTRLDGVIARLKAFADARG